MLVLVVQTYIEVAHCLSRHSMIGKDSLGNFHCITVILYYVLLRILLCTVKLLSRPVTSSSKGEVASRTQINFIFVLLVAD
jgi:hypothetical protein